LCINFCVPNKLFAYKISHSSFLFYKESTSSYLLVYLGWSDSMARAHAISSNICSVTSGTYIHYVLLWSVFHFKVICRVIYGSMVIVGDFWGTKLSFKSIYCASMSRRLYPVPSINLYCYLNSFRSISLLTSFCSSITFNYHPSLHSII